MEIKLSRDWTLTTEHGSAPGQPVLVKRGDRRAYGPGDIIKVSTGRHTMAGDYVRGLAKTAKLDLVGRELVDKFINLEE